MCGRFGSFHPPWDLARALGARVRAAAFVPRYNVAPTQPVPTLLDDGARVVDDLRWGLVPAWTPEPRAGKTAYFNVRIESVATSPLFRDAFGARRCAVFADGYYEWRKNADGTKTPMWIARKDGATFLFAGIWEARRSRATGETTRSCAILTQPPNAFVAAIHSRMPVVLDDAALLPWLDPAAHDARDLLALLEPTPPELWTAHAVSPRVGNVRYDDPGLIAPF
jgi:putative SOS response-associated peptidase YedK